MLSYEITIYVFLILAFVTFGKLLIRGDTEDKKLQKIFGGLVILIAAILSKNAWVICVSLFISGLIVASEDFMRFLAAVMRTSGDKVADTVMALKTKKASPKEIDKKLLKESKEVDTPLRDDTILEIGPAPDTEEIRTSSDKVRERFKEIKIVEELVQPYLKEKFSDNYDAHMRITKNTESFVVDGIVRKNSKISLIIEIKYLTVKSFSILKYLIVRYREKLLRLGIKRHILMIIVSKEMTKAYAHSMFEDNKGLANLWFFKLVNGHLEQIEATSGN